MLFLSRLTLVVFFVTASQCQQLIETGSALVGGRVLPYQVIGGRAIYDGDIDLGPAESFREPEIPKAGSPPRSVYINAQQFHWPSGNIPYVIDPDIPNPQRIHDGIANWNNATPVHFAPRVNEANYVHFRREQNNGVCFATIGLVGGEQFVRTDDACNANTMTHEMGHSIGLLHEQARSDRDYYLTVNYANLDKRRLGDESTRAGTSVDGGGFDYGSIMIYTRYTGSRDRQMPVLETIPAGMALDGFGHGLSAGDIDRVTRMYGAVPATTTITTNPEGLQVIVDGQAYIGPKAFNWASGTQHTVDVPEPQGDGTPMRYRFGRWDDHGAKAHTITASSDVTVFSVSFIREYLVKIAVAAAGGGSVAITPSSPDGYYGESAEVHVTATPADGFTFLGWNGFLFTTLEGWSIPSTTFRVTIPNLNYTASFTRSPFITVNTDPPNLPVTIGTSRASAPRQVVVAAGGNLMVSAEQVITFGTATSQYVFQGWSDGGAAAHGITAPASGPMPTVTARYQVQHLVSTAVTGSGRVTVTPTSPDGYYDHGTKLQITAIPSAGFQLQSWGGDLSGNALSTSLTVDDQMYVQATFAQPFRVTIPGTLNAASFLGGSVSPGEMLTLFGLQFGPTGLTVSTLDSAGRFPALLAGTRVLFDGVAAPLIYVSPNQIAPIVPYAVAGRATTSVQVEYNGVRTPAVNMPVVAAAPALFTANSSGFGQGAILNQDGSVNSAANPADKGSVVVLFVTGEGATDPDGVDGKVAGTVPIPKPRGAVKVLIGGPQGIGKNAVVLYAGGAPSLVAGVMQMNIQIPTDAPSGNVPISFSVGGISSSSMATVAIR